MLKSGASDQGAEILLMCLFFLRKELTRIGIIGVDDGRVGIFGVLLGEEAEDSVYEGMRDWG